MKLYGIGTAKNEDDVIGDSIEHALRYCDKVIYLDNDSADRTWEVIQEKAAQHPDRVVAFGKIDLPFTNGIRRLIYDAYNSSELGPGDWWMKLDADEFVHEDPRPVIDEAVDAGKDGIRAWHAQFYLTDVDVAALEAGEEDVSLPVTERRRYYRTNWRQVHLWRNVPGGEWGDPSLTTPGHVARIHSRAVLNRHYQFRDPDQITRRLAARLGNADFAHVGSLDWKSVVRPAAECHRWEAGGPLRVDRAYYYSLRVRQELARRLGRRMPVE